MATHKMKLTLFVVVLSVSQLVKVLPAQEFDQKLLQGILDVYEMCFKEVESFSKFAMRFYLAKIAELDQPDWNPRMKELLLSKFKKILPVDDSLEKCSKKSPELKGRENDELTYPEYKKTRYCLEIILENYLQQDIEYNSTIFVDCVGNPTPF
ncbi:unnamed protein product [Callosobruchus maculatus]|uniref:Uncharacterized protein n=1 Tax=Callosobruchus maculatus TaxID=64391 RepID=A0A653D7U8_CALMS|nr:unnamed protein product [Callosobruchus maculatus]